MIQNDEMVKCPMTGGDLCYKVKNTPEITTYMSLSSGFWTNSLMKEGEEFFEQQMVPLPELYRDLAWKDPETELVWIPQYVNVEDKGTVFPMGKNSTSWGWAATKVREATKEEMAKDKLTKSKYRTDMNTMEIFNQNEYVKALDYIGALAEE